MNGFWFRYVLVAFALSLVAAQVAHATALSIEADFRGTEWYEAEKTLPKVVVKAIDQSILVLEAALKNLKRQIAKQRATGGDSSSLQRKWYFAKSVLDALDTAPIYYQSKNTGLCGSMSVQGQGRFNPAAVQTSGFIVVCPGALRSGSMRDLVSIILHEVVHLADERNGNPHYYSQGPRASKAYECSTDARALELYQLGTGQPGARGYDCN